MKKSLPRRLLTHKELDPFASDYLTEGRKQESWEIIFVEIENDTLNAQVRMRSCYRSETDSEGFHLTVFSALEFLSQLMITYAHVWAGYPEKRMECFMIESSIVNRKAIRDPESIRVEMVFPNIRKIKNSLIAETSARVFDDHGEFVVTLKGFMPDERHTK